MTTVHQFIDAALSVPLLVWIGVIGIGLLVGVAFVAVTAPLTTPEQREQIARAHRELRGARGMPDAATPILPWGPRAAARAGQAARAARSSTRSPGTATDGTSHQRGHTGRSADGLGPVWRVRPRRTH